MKRLLIKILAVGIGLTAIIPCPAAAKYGIVPEVTVLKVSKAPVIDGILNDNCWLGALQYKSLFAGFYAADFDRIADWQPLVYVVYDKKYLYIAYSCPIPDKDSLRNKSAPGKNFNWTDDLIQIFIEPDLDSLYYYFAVNSAGFPTDPALKAVANIQKRYWTAEFAIPWENVRKKKIEEGQLMGFSIVAHQSYVANGWIFWLPLFGNPQNPRRFSYIKLGTERSIICTPSSPEEDDF